MDEELKKALNEQFESFKKSLPNFVDKSGLDLAFTEFKAEQEKMYGDAVAKAIEPLENAVKEQGVVLAAMKNANPTKEKGLGNLLSENKAAFEEMVKAGGSGKIEIHTSFKAVTEASVGNDTNMYRDPVIGQIHRGMPFMRSLFPTVRLGGNSHGSVKWLEQATAVNNATNVAETRVAGSQSTITWDEKTLSGKRIFDFFKVTLDSLKDMDFMQGEITNFINTNMRLKENDQLINGLGTGNEIKGIKAYATAFSTTIDKIQRANLHDMVGKIRTQITNGTLGAANPNYALTNGQDVDNLRYSKTEDGAYVFPQLTFGETARLGNVPTVENPLMTADTLLVGDFNLATLYIWDDVVVEIAQIEDDKKTGNTTVMCYLRENLRVKDVDAGAFVKVASITSDLATITAPIAGPTA